MARAAAFGTATAITAAFSAALTKSTTIYVSQGWGHVFTHAQPYLLAVTGLGTVFLLQNALHAGPITASRTTLVTVNPLVSILIGITLFGDRLRGGLPRTVMECIALAVLITGVVVLAQTPLVVGVAGEDDPGELLADARQRRSKPLVIAPEVEPAVVQTEVSTARTQGRTGAAPGHPIPPARANSAVISSDSRPSRLVMAVNRAAVTRASPRALWGSSQERPK